ncbi:suppressor protein SRP40-like [Heracleum sosnowskyi]|uniref:Suppressor protein SRP40-like n=1 Tax=Heracleum sosnowskyi TaxID=360622 RepID=A0AAD8LZP7_9APIA|nr:suppressor protein SRP40-like [Heracleum sosnowskyi]
MEHNKKKVATSSSSSSSFTMDLFGPKDSPQSSQSTGVFGSVFGPPSTGLGRDSSISGPARKQDYGNTKQGIQDYNSQRNYIKGESGGKQSKDRTTNSTNYNQNELSNPCYYSSSIYYGGQEVYSPANSSHHAIKKDGGSDDFNGNNSNSASRGNWWEGSLYY